MLLRVRCVFLLTANHAPAIGRRLNLHGRIADSNRRRLFSRAGGLIRRALATELRHLNAFGLRVRVACTSHLIPRGVRILLIRRLLAALLASLPGLLLRLLPGAATLRQSHRQPTAAVLVLLLALRAVDGVQTACSVEIVRTAKLGRLRQPKPPSRRF